MYPTIVTVFQDSTCYIHLSGSAGVEQLRSWLEYAEPSIPIVFTRGPISGQSHVPLPACEIGVDRGQVGDVMLTSAHCAPPDFAGLCVILTEECKPNAVAAALAKALASKVSIIILV
jgi:hypothetical protein